MAVTLVCPNLKCGKTMVTDDGARGKVVRCVHCNKPLMVPPLQRQAAGEEDTAKRGAR